MISVKITHKLLLVLALSLAVLMLISHLVAATKVTKLTGTSAVDLDADSDADSDLDQVAREVGLRSPSGTALSKHAANKNNRRDLGLLAIKALLLGPLIGITIKAALIRGLIWALLAYGLHLFFPALLSTLGLGSGLVGFARQIRPDYGQMAAAYFLNLIQTLPGQYNHMISPIIESIRAIPEGHCRYRAVCETASHLVRNVRSMSTTLQRVSATVYMNFGTDYSKAWLDGIVQNDCALKYQQCTTSPFSMVAARLAQTLNK